MSTYTSQEEFRSAYETLHATYNTGKTKSLKWRKWQLKQLYWMINDNEAAIMEALNKDLNRHNYESLWMELTGTKTDVLTTLGSVEKWAKGEAPQDAGFVFGTLGKAWLRKEPLGVGLVIGAWNFPFYTLLSPVIAGIAAGNCLILKPSELASACSQLLADLAPKYLDQSALRVCTGGAKETSYMLENKFNHIFYTGGSKVGRIVATAAAKHLTPVVLELGGQAPAIVTKSADLNLAGKRIAAAKLSNSGQICLNVNHIFADPSIHDELVEKVIHWMKEFLKDGTDHLAHIISDGHFSRVTGLLKNTKGNVVYTGNSDASTKFVHPTIITGIKQSDSLLSEELFAPFVPVLKADTQEALAIINSMAHPLALYIFSKDQKEIDHILDSTTSGGVTINDTMIHAAVPSAPFGGVGESGYGSYHGKYGFDAFSHTRTVVTMPSYLEMFMSFRYAPFSMENRSKVEAQMPKVTFKRGEQLGDQQLTGPGRSIIGTIGLCTAVLAATALGDQLSGNRLGFGRRVADLISSFKF